MRGGRGCTGASETPGFIAGFDSERQVLTDNTNDIVHTMEVLGCTLRRHRHAIAVATAQYNGWLAASQLKLPTCSKLDASGQVVLAIQCSPLHVTFPTEITRCGPQPRYKNKTIAADGWKLVEAGNYSWARGFVNFNDRAYAYRNGSWQLLEATVILPENVLAHTFRYMDVDHFAYKHQSNPAYETSVRGHMSIVADIAPTPNEHPATDYRLGGHTTTVEMPAVAAEKSGFVLFWEYTKVFVIGTIITIVTVALLRVFYFCGVFSCIWKVHTQGCTRLKALSCAGSKLSVEGLEEVLSHLSSRGSSLSSAD